MLSLVGTARCEGEQRALRFRLAALLRCSEEMLSCAERGDWDGVEILERERRQELEDCFARALDDDASPLVAEAVATLLYLNEQLVKVVAQARQAVLDEQQAGRRRQQAALCYGGRQV